MILGIGIDSIEIERFAGWHNKKSELLAHIFTLHEIEYCISSPEKSAERFAVRFAAKEAFYKALCSWQPELTTPLRLFCPAIEVIKADNGAPKLSIDWGKITYPSTRKLAQDDRTTKTPVRPDRGTTCRVEGSEQISTLLSLTHTTTTATALVILTQTA